jgi:glycosyltransferase involved in cell wall biosynthesis
MLFTVITPSFNCAEYIRINIESVRAQGFEPEQLEHWIIDGGSTDGTIEVLKGESGIQWLSERDRGLSDAVNKGIQRARGDWIVWVNADDWLAPGALRTFLQSVERNPAARIFCGAQSWMRYDGSLEQIVPAWDYDLKELLGSRTGINQASTFIHRDVFATVGLLDVEDKYTMDYEFLVRAMHHYQCVPIPEVLSFYRRRRGSITDANMLRQFQNFLRLRRRYRQPYLCLAEFRVRFYLYTDWLRRLPWVRRAVRRAKRLVGHEPLHPIPGCD